MTGLRGLPQAGDELQVSQRNTCSQHFLFFLCASTLPFVKERVIRGHGADALRDPSAGTEDMKVYEFPLPELPRLIIPCKLATRVQVVATEERARRIALARGQRSDDYRRTALAAALHAQKAKEAAAVSNVVINKILANQEESCAGCAGPGLSNASQTPRPRLPRSRWSHEYRSPPRVRRARPTASSAWPCSRSASSGQPSSWPRWVGGFELFASHIEWVTWVTRGRRAQWYGTLVGWGEQEGWRGVGTEYTAYTFSSACSWLLNTAMPSRRGLQAQGQQVQLALPRPLALHQQHEARQRLRWAQQRHPRWRRRR